MTYHLTAETPAYGDCVVPGCLNAPTDTDGICEEHRIALERQHQLAATDADIPLRLLHEGNVDDLALYGAWHEAEERRREERRARAVALAAQRDKERQERAQRREEAEKPTFQDHVDFAAAKYVEAIFEGLGNEGHGGRNNALWRAAVQCGHVVGGGHLDRSEAEQRLTKWADDVELERSESQGVIRRGLDKGIPDPWRPALEERGEQPPQRIPWSMRRRRR